MRAVRMNDIGDPGVLVPGEAPEPTLGAGQVLVEVAFSNVTFVETQLRSGRGPFAIEPPIIPGNGVGGIVAAVGEGVDRALVGSRVITSTGGSGAYAQRVVVDEDAPIPVPDDLALDVAVALLADGRTAVMMADAAGIQPGERVVVEAAAGGVGSLLVQLAARAGAVTVAAAGGERKLGVALELGARHTVDYRRPHWVRSVRAATGGADVVFDGVGGDVAREAFTLLAEGGRMVSFGLSSGEWADIDDAAAAARGVTLLRPVAAPPQLREHTQRALAHAVAGALRPLIGQRFPLERAADAHAAIEARATIGKTLLDVEPLLDVR